MPFIVPFFTIMQTHVVIMAGGIGSRFWPMSTPEYPKQFIDVLGTGKTMIQMTVDRFLPICPVSNMWVVTSAKYVDIVREQIPGIPEDNILAEPAARNTAPCIAYACWKIKKKLNGEKVNIVVTPSDALVLDAPAYREVISEALAFTADSDAIVTVGIKPTRPETGYGYIEVGQPECGNLSKVSKFREKPDLATAESYLAAGNFLWNAGIFVWNSATIEAALREFAPQITGIMDRIAADFFTGRENETISELFPQCDKISIDYAVMEKSSRIYTLPGDFGWSDLGTWGSLRQNSSTDADGNAVIGSDITLYDCEGCVAHVSDLGKVVVQGLKDYIIAEKNGRLLICRLDQEQRIKDFQK